MKYAIIDGEIVINTIEYESQPTNPPPGFEDHIISIQHDKAAPGWRFIAGEFIEPEYEKFTPTLDDIKSQAIRLLSSTDWTEIPSVTNPNSVPYLLNASEFIVYRQELRKIAISPTLNPEWPIQPNESWSEI